MESDSLMAELKETVIAPVNGIDFLRSENEADLLAFMGISSHIWVERKMKNWKCMSENRKGDDRN